MMINVEFKGGPHPDFERELEKILGECESSGCCMFGEIVRDMQFDYKWKSKKQFISDDGRCLELASDYEVRPHIQNQQEPDQQEH